MELNGLLNGYQIDVLSTTYLVTLTPSVIGSFSVLVVSIVRWRHLREQVHLLVQLALADLLAALILLLTNAMNKVSTENSVAICEYSLPLSLTFYLISLLLMVVYAWKSKNAIQGWRAQPAEDEVGQRQCKRIIIALPVYATVWLVPIGMYFAYVLTPFIKAAVVTPITGGSRGVSNDTKYCTSCLLFLHRWWDSCSDDKAHDTVIKAFLFLVVTLVMTSCCAIYYKVGKWYERHQHEGLFPVEGDGRSRRRSRRIFSISRNMVLVILICWAPALLLVLLSTLMAWINIEQRSLFGLYVIQAATVSLQGFLNSMVYAWKRPNFREAVLGESTPLVAYNHLAFFDESLRNLT
ncbi:transmembrane protein 116 isoform X2 [Channa argus]|uniref:transmembrane protein 116 isoform X2 n=1 Tax=Channa argus TaxID=215402 RepID=UPI0035209A93